MRGKVKTQPLFGEIFSTYYESILSDKHILEAEDSIKAFMTGKDLQGRAFLDAGCGGGVFSMAAHNLKAERVVSFDIDPQMVMYAQTRQKEKLPKAPWSILEGDILSREFVQSLPMFDYVYCWGVVHHTGDMWKALENIVSRVKLEGEIYLGIYNDANAFGLWDDGRFGSSLFWKRVKNFLHKRSSFFKFVLFKFICSAYRVLTFLRGRSIKDESEAYIGRGMEWETSIKDWLFGHPYEYASVDEVVKFMNRKGFYLEDIKSNIGLRTNHYLFSKKR